MPDCASDRMNREAKRPLASVRLPQMLHSEALYVAIGKKKAPKVKRTAPDAVLGPSGIWNEETLEITEWESPAHRVVLPRDLQDALGIETPVLRWDKSKRDAVLRDHSKDATVIHTINDHLTRWT